MDRPIIFSAPMVSALLDGRKTQTRRLLKPHPLHKPQPHTIDYHDGNLICRWLSGIRHDIPSPYAPGDRLYVREAHYLTDDGESEYPVFAAEQQDVDEHLAAMHTTMASWPNIDWSKHLRLRPSIHMPRWASRITLTVTDVRVQRLQEISEADAVAEGCAWSDLWEGFTPCPDAGDARYFSSRSAVSSFEQLWCSLHGPEAWDANPWVVALTFTVRKGNIDHA